MRSGGFFDLAQKAERLEELEEISAADSFWNDQEAAQKVLQERSRIQRIVDKFQHLEVLLSDSEAALELAIETKDEEFVSEALSSSEALRSSTEELEFVSKMSGDHDSSHAIVEINGGSGGTEAQDWAEMLLRMYLRWAERKEFKIEQLEYNPGEQAGVKGATILVQGDFAYGLLRSEQGVHRLVRISPFDSNARRHTSFASVSVTPDIDDDVEVEIDDKDIRIDTYRASGAGGQHVNKTDSAVRITHLPTSVAVACQNERSQHKNKARAMKLLKAKLFELLRAEQVEKLDEIKGERKRIEFGSQIRSYVMQPYRLVKDLRTQHETSDVDGVLDGKIEPFIQEYLLSSENKG